MKMNRSICVVLALSLMAMLPLSASAAGLIPDGDGISQAKYDVPKDTLQSNQSVESVAQVKVGDTLSNYAAVESKPELSVAKGVVHADGITKVKATQFVKPDQRYNL
jgi:hypothetical protein